MSVSDSRGFAEFHGSLLLHLSVATLPPCSEAAVRWLAGYCLILRPRFLQKASARAYQCCTLLPSLSSSRRPRHLGMCKELLLGEVNILPGSCLLRSNSRKVAPSICLLLLGWCEWIRLLPAEMRRREER